MVDWGGSSREGRSKKFRKYFGHKFLMDMGEVKGRLHTDFQIWSITGKEVVQCTEIGE